MEPIINLELPASDVNFLLQVLGELPTKSNAYPLLVKIVQQAEPQMPKKEQAAPAEAEAAAAE